MSARRLRVRWLVACSVLASLLVLPTAGRAADPPSFEFATPVFGLARAPEGRLLVADAGAGIVELRRRTGRLLVELPNVTDVAPVGERRMWALTTLPDGKLYEFERPGDLDVVANIGAFERRVNPDGAHIESNPFDLARIGRRRVLVADAAANAVVIADRRGRLDWVATLPTELVPTRNVKRLAGCPDPIPDFAFACDLPRRIPAEGVPTSVAVGPDGAYYVSELKGFPAPRNRSRIWRIEPGTRHARCGSSPACTVVADGFTSIVDINFGHDGTLHVVELDEGSWFAVELGAGTGGTVNACSWPTFSCIEEATGLTIPMAVAVRGERVFAVVSALIPGQARVIEI
jgi:hypothetical protein